MKSYESLKLVKKKLLNFLIIPNGYVKYGLPCLFQLAATESAILFFNC